jgi:hypothetical protein
MSNEDIYQRLEDTTFLVCAQVHQKGNKVAFTCSKLENASTSIKNLFNTLHVQSGEYKSNG